MTASTNQKDILKTQLPTARCGSIHDALLGDGVTVIRPKLTKKSLYGTPSKHYPLCREFFLIIYPLLRVGQNYGINPPGPPCGHNLALQFPLYALTVVSVYSNDGKRNNCCSCIFVYRKGNRRTDKQLRKYFSLQTVNSFQAVQM